MAKLFACGDIVNYQNEDGAVCASDIESIIQQADYSVCNFEAPVRGYGTPQLKSGPHLSQPRCTVNRLKQHGFDLLLLANNHMLDYGTQGLTATLDAAREFGLDTTGAGIDEIAAYKPHIINLNGIKVGIINACESQFGVIDHFERGDKSGYAWINHPKIDTSILKLKKECDFVVVFAHAGLENYNIPQKEWRIRYKHLCDLGADVIVGSHPHVPQGYEYYNESLIFYSLGNFYFDYKCSYKNHSFAVLIDLVKGETPKFEPVHHITKNNQVQVSEEKVDLFSLCRRLEEIYIKEHDEMILNAYKKNVKPKLLMSIYPFLCDGTFKGTLKNILAALLGRRKNIAKELRHLHLVRNESYYYVMRRSLEIINRRS